MCDGLYFTVQNKILIEASDMVRSPCNSSFFDKFLLLTGFSFLFKKFFSDMNVV